MSRCYFTQSTQSYYPQPQAHMSSTNTEKNILRSRISGAHEKSQLHSFSGSHLDNPQFMHLVVWLLVFFHVWTFPKAKYTVIWLLKKTCLGKTSCQTSDWGQSSTLINKRCY